MTEDPTRHFDAPRAVSVIGAAISLMRRHWPTVVALIVTVAILEMMAFGLVGIDAIGSDRIDASVASITIFVAAEPEASAAEVDALGPLIRAVPGISDATLRSKDDALKSMIATGLPPPDGRNPLPDVWIVRLQPGTAANSPSVAIAWQEKRHSLASLPRVASVSADERWIATIDRGVARWRAGWPVAQSIALGILALAAAGASYLAGQGLRTPSGPDQRIKRNGVQVLAILAALTGLIVTLLGYVGSWLAVDQAVEAAIGMPSWSFGQLLATRPHTAASIAIAAMGILAVGLVAGCRENE